MASAAWLLQPGNTAANSSPPNRPAISAGLKAFREDVRKYPQHMIANRVAKGVVDLFELIEVERERESDLDPVRFGRKYAVCGS